jgi:branched-chain amino acid transport system permease protein
LLIIVVAIGVIGGLMFVIKYTRFGRSIVATSQDAEMARMLGVNTKKIYLLTYLISAGLAAVAGIMLSPIYSVYPTMGAQVTQKGLIVCILGGLGSVEGSIIAGAILGLAESIGVTFVGTAWKDIIGYAIFFIVLFVKPSGMFGRKEV